MSKEFKVLNDKLVVDNMYHLDPKLNDLTKNNEKPMVDNMSHICYTSTMRNDPEG